jgi:hypothetical protein
MHKFVLIDTCVLRELISPVEFSGYLKQIVSWQEKGNITILCGDTLKKEWKKHREIEIQRIDKILASHVKSLKLSKLFEQTPEIGEVQLSAADKLLRSQVLAIDKLLDTCRQIPDESSVASQVWIHRVAEKAPFHNKLESDNDAMILFSALADVINSGGSELIFLSSNYSDYAAPGDRSQIHPDIAAAYPKIKIVYFEKLSESVKSLTDLGLPSGRPVQLHRKPVKELILFNKKVGVVSQMETYLAKRFSDIRFLPKKLFCVHAPFILAPNHEPRDRPFTLNTDNPELYQIFSDLQSSEVNLLGSDKTEAQVMPESTAGVLQHLRGNLVHAITLNEGNLLDLPQTSIPGCNCGVCCYRKANFGRLFLDLKDSRPSGDLTLKDAYLQYLLGDIKNSVETLKQVAELAKTDQKWLSYYIARYNLSLMPWHLRFGVATTARDQELITSLENIHLDTDYTISHNESLADILDYLKEGNFLDQALMDVRNLVDRIKDKQLDKNTGWTDDTRLLMDLYFETMYFIEQNYLMLDNFHNVFKLTEYFTEGLFASYASHKDLGGKLLYFSDAIIEKLVSYGNYEEIKKYRNRYKIKFAKYESEQTEFALVKRLLSLLDNYQAAVDHYNQEGVEGYQAFWSKYRRMFHNSLTLVGMMDIKPQEIDAICEQLIAFIQLEQHIHAYELSETLSYFVRHKAEQIDHKHLENLLSYAFGPKNLDHGQLIRTIYNMSRNKPIRLELTHEEWEQLQAVYLVNEELNRGRETIGEICILYGFLPEKTYKDEITKFLIYNLKAAFSAEVYYWAVINNIIRPTKKLTAKYDAAISDWASKGRQLRIFEQGFYHDDDIDAYLNFCFHFKKPLDVSLSNQFSELDNYYRWVTDMDNFDYRRFEPDWLFHYQTNSYHAQFCKSKRLQGWMRNHAFGSHDPRIGQLYIKLYTRPLKKLA